MESDLSLIEMNEEDDSLIQQSPDRDPTPSKSSLNYSTFSPFALPPSHTKNLKDSVRVEKPSSSSSKTINNKENINFNSVEVPKLGMEPMQMKRRKKGGGYNLRKSLAWDRAFFTDEGILDPLELTLITGVDANTCGGGLPAISEEGNSSCSSDVRSTNDSSDMEGSVEAPLKELRDKNRITKGHREKTGCMMRNHDSLLHHKITHKVLSSNYTNRGGSKVGGCSEPLAATSLKRPANSNSLKTAKKESKFPKLPTSKPGSCIYATTKGSMATSQLRHNLIPKPTINVEKNFGLKSSSQNAHSSQTKAKTGSGNLHLSVKELAQKTAKNLTHSSKAASSTKLRSVQPVQFNRAISQSEMVQDTSKLCKIQEESAPLAAKHLAQHAAANTNNSLPEATRLTGLGPCHIQRASKGLIISDTLNSCESQERPAALARPSGLRLPSPSLRLFDQVTASERGSLQQKKTQQYMGSDRKIGELRPETRLPMKSNGITENVSCVVPISNKECCTPSTQLRPSPNYMLNTSTKGVPDSKTHQNLVTKIMPRVDIKLEFECRGSEQEKIILGHEDTTLEWKGEEGLKVGHPTEQLAGNVGICHQLTSKDRVPEKKYKSVVNNKEDGLKSYTAFLMSTFGRSSQHQEGNISTGVDDLAQTSPEQTDTEKSDDASPKVNPESHLDAGSKVSVESHEQAGNVGACHQLTSEDKVPETKYISVVHNKEDGLQSYTAFSMSTFGPSTQHQEDNISTRVDDLAQTSREQTDTDKSDDASPKVNPESYLDAGSQVFLESHEKEESRERGDDVGTAKCVPLGIENYSVVQHGQEYDVSKVVDDKGLPTEEDDSPCSRTVSITSTHSLVDQGDETELKGVDSSCIPYQILNTKQRNDHADGIDAFPANTITTTTTTTLSSSSSSCVRDPSAEESNSIHINSATSIRSKAQLHDSLVRDTVTQLLNDNPSAQGFHIEPTTSIENKYQLPVTLLLHDNPSSTEGLQFVPTTSIKKKLQLQDTGAANGSPKCFEGTTPCISALPNSQLSVTCTLLAKSSCLEEGTFPNVTYINDHLSQEKSVSSVILMEVPGQRQDGVDVDLIPRELAPLIDDQNQSSVLSHHRPQVEIISETASLGDDTFVKRQSMLQGAQGTGNYPQSLEKERMDIAATIVEAQLKIHKENHMSQEMGITIAAEKSHDSCGNETASLGDDTIAKRESVRQGAQGTRNYPQSLEKERMDIAAPIVEAQLKNHKETNESQETGITFAAKKSHDSCDNITETKPAIQGSFGGSKTYSQFQSENYTCEGSGPINNIFKMNVEDGQGQLLDDDALVQSCSRLTSEAHNYSIESAGHNDILGKQAGLSNTGIKLERVSKSNEYFQQESVCKAVGKAVLGSDVYKCDPRPSNAIIPDDASHVIEEVGNSEQQLCVEYKTSVSTVIDLPAEHNENCSDRQSAGCGDLTLTLDLGLEPSLEDKMFVKNSTGMEDCSTGEESCSFPAYSMLEEKTTLFLDDQVLMKDSLLSAEKILDSVIVVPEENTNASAQTLPMELVNGENKPQDFDRIAPKVETYDSFTVGQSNSCFSPSQQLTTGVKTTSTPESCCLVGGGDDSLITKTTCMIGDQGSKISIGEQVDATQMVSEFQHESDDLKDDNDATMLIKKSNSIKRQDNSLVINPPNAVPFSDEWLAAIEAAGEEILTMKSGAVQHSPQDKSLPEPSPWSPVKKKANHIGPYDCTKYLNSMPSNSQVYDQ